MMIWFIMLGMLVLSIWFALYVNKKIMEHDEIERQIAENETPGPDKLEPKYDRDDLN